MSCQLAARNSIPAMDRFDEIALARWEDDGGPPARPPRFSLVTRECAVSSETKAVDASSEECALRAALPAA